MENQQKEPEEKKEPVKETFTRLQLKNAMIYASLNQLSVSEIDEAIKQDDTWIKEIT